VGERVGARTELVGPARREAAMRHGVDVDRVGGSALLGAWASGSELGATSGSSSTTGAGAVASRGGARMWVIGGRPTWR
jgi:hypothetical protein